MSAHIFNAFKIGFIIGTGEAILNPWIHQRALVRFPNLNSAFVSSLLRGAALLILWANS